MVRGYPQALLGEKPMRTIFINCEVCQTEGRILRSNGGPDDIDYGICPACNGACEVEVECEPITLSDLDDWPLQEGPWGHRH